MKTGRLVQVLMLCLWCGLLSCHPMQKTSGTLTFITIDEELELNKMLSLEAAKQFKLVRNQILVGYMNQIGREIGLQSDWNGLPYTVHVINEPDLNHFSLPGGSVFITRGIIDSSDTVCEVALVIAHEIAHIAARDGIRRVGQKYGYAFAAQSLIGQNPEISAQIISQLYADGTILDYSPEEEFLADAKAVKYAWKANYDPAGLVDILKKIRKTESKSPALTASLKMTHPSTSKRIRKVRLEVRRAPHKESLRKNYDDYTEIKDLMEKIPQ